MMLPSSPPSFAPSRAHQLAVRLLFALTVALAGCRPEIGDKCQTSVDCSQLGDRLCDVSQPDGYCTIYNCEPKASNGATKCPDEAVCIVYAAEPSPVLGCENRLGNTPYSRSFCMKTCDNTTDCRSGYVCLDVGAPGNRWAAVDADGAGKVCTQAFTPPSIPVREPGVCTAGDPVEGTDGAGGAGGMSSEPDGAGGAGAATGSGGVGGA
jgi:hypothetical protein